VQAYEEVRRATWQTIPSLLKKPTQTKTNKHRKNKELNRDKQTKPEMFGSLQKITAHLAPSLGRKAGVAEAKVLEHLGGS